MITYLKITAHRASLDNNASWLQSGVDISGITLWLSHECPTTTQRYIEADLAMKEKALSRL
ncbi:MAG: hypothetical protein Q7U58_14630 [Hydrogenophaga sp.]|nr:hypothetical protein [Hydrogenophaga sp.]